MRIGETIKEIRKAKKIRQSDFAEMVGISGTYLSLIENDKRKPTLDVLQKISDSLSIPYPILAFLSLAPEDVSEEKRKLFMQLSNPYRELLKSLFIS